MNLTETMTTQEVTAHIIATFKGRIARIEGLLASNPTGWVIYFADNGLGCRFKLNNKCDVTGIENADVFYSLRDARMMPAVTNGMGQRAIIRARGEALVQGLHGLRDSLRHVEAACAKAIAAEEVPAA